MSDKQQELDGMPEDDRAGKLAKELLEANEMISEGNERRSVLQKELSEELVNTNRKKITIDIGGGVYKTFTHTRKEAKDLIKVSTER